MSEQRSRPGPPRARPLAELAFGDLLERVGELSRSWALALIGERPPAAIGEVALEDLARESPALLSALLGALRSDEELWQLAEGARSGHPPARLIPALAGASGPADVVAAVEALRGVVWEALLGEFGHLASEPASPRRLSELGDRLAAVCAALLPAALEGLAAPAEALVRSAAEPARQAGGFSIGEPDGATARPAAADGTGRAHPIARPGAVIVDELAATEAGTAEAPPAPTSGEPGQTLGALPTEIQIRDERGDEGPAAWTRSIGRQLERFERDGASFAVLLVELRGAPEGSSEAVEEVIAAELGGGTTTRERAGRYWLLSPGSDRLAAAALAARLTRALEELLRASGMEHPVAIGTAVCPEDGRRASALAAHADVGLYAARSEQRQTAGQQVLPAAEG